MADDKNFQSGGLDNNFTGELTSVEVPNTLPTSTGQTQLDQDIIAGTSSLGDIDAKALAFASQLPQPTTPTLDSMAEAQNINVPDVIQPPKATADVVLTSATSNIADIIKTLTPPETETEVKEQTLLDQMAELTGELGQQAADQLTAEQSSQIPELRQQFSDINAKILAKNAEFNTLKASFDQENLLEEGKPQTLSRLQGAQNRNFRTFLAQKNALAAEAGFLQAQAQGLQGKITDAQNTVNRAIDLKYSTIESQLNTYQAQLNAIQPQLNREEKIQAQAQQLIVDNQRQELEDSKAKDKQIQSIMLNLAANGASSELLARATNAGSIAEAAEIQSEFVRSLQVPTVIPGTQPVSTEPTQTFEQFVSEREEELGQSIADREGLRTEYEELVPLPVSGDAPVILSDLAQSVWDGTLTIKDITPTQRQTVGPELNRAGYKQHLSAQVTSEIRAIIDGVTRSKDALDDIPSNKKGKFQGRISEFLKLEEDIPEIAKFNTTVKLVGQQITRLWEKGRLSDQDRLFYLSLMPNLRQNEVSAQKSVESLMGVLRGKIGEVVEDETGELIETEEASQADIDYVSSLNL